MSIPVNQQDYDKYMSMFKGNFYKGSITFRSMLETPDVASVIVTSPAAMLAVFTDSFRSNVDALCRDLLEDSEYYDTGLLTYFNTITDKEYTTWAALVADATCLAVIFSDDNLIDLLTRSDAAVTAMNASAQAATMLSASDTYTGKYVAKLAGLDTATFSTMTAIAANATARATVLASSLAMSFCNKSDMAIGKLIAPDASLAPADYASYTVMINDSTARAAIVAATTAMTRIYANDLAIAKLLAAAAGEDATDYGGMSDVVADSDLMTLIANSSTIMGYVVASTVATTAVAGSSTAMAAIVANTTVAVPAIVANANAMNVMVANSVSRNAFLNAADALRLVKNSTMAMAKLLAQLTGQDPTTYANTYDLMGVADVRSAIVASQTLRALIVGSESAFCNLVTALCSLRNTYYQSYSTLFDDSSFAIPVFTNPTTQALLEENSYALTGLVGREYALSSYLAFKGGVSPYDNWSQQVSFAANETAWNAIASSEAARSFIQTYFTGYMRNFVLGYFTDNTYYSVAKLAAGYAGLDPEDYSTFSGLISDATAAAAICNSTFLMQAYALSGPFNKMCQNATMMAAFASNLTAISAMCNSPYVTGTYPWSNNYIRYLSQYDVSATAITSNRAAFNKLLETETGTYAIGYYSNGYKAILANTTLTLDLVNNTTAWAFTVNRRSNWAYWAAAALAGIANPWSLGIDDIYNNADNMTAVLASADATNAAVNVVHASTIAYRREVGLTMMLGNATARQLVLDRLIPVYTANSDTDYYPGASYLILSNAEAQAAILASETLKAAFMSDAGRYRRAITQLLAAMSGVLGSIEPTLSLQDFFYYETHLPAFFASATALAQAAANRNCVYYIGTQYRACSYIGTTELIKSTFAASPLVETKTITSVSNSYSALVPAGNAYVVSCTGCDPVLPHHTNGVIAYDAGTFDVRDRAFAASSTETAIDAFTDRGAGGAACANKQDAIPVTATFKIIRGEGAPW